MKINRTLFILAVGVFGITTTEFGVIGILPEIATAFKISIDKAGWLLSAFALIVAVFGPFMMMLFSSFDRKKIMAFSLLVFTLSNLFSIFATNFLFLLTVRMLPAFFHPVYWSIALSVAAKSVTPKESTKAISVVFSGLTIATVLGVPLATFITDIFNWRSSFLLSAIINLASLIGLLCFLPKIENTNYETDYSKKEILKNWVLWINIFLVFFIITAMYATYGYMADYLKSVSGMNGKEISLMLLLFGTVGIFGNRLAGKYMGSHPFLTTAIFVIALMSVHILLHFCGNHYITIVMTVAIWGLIHSGGFLISNLTITASVSEAPEFINSIFTSCGNFAVTAGSVIGGYCIVNFGIHQVPLSTVFFLVLSFIILLVKKKLFRN
jgi:DHA1 family inner membrane transport protein